MKGCRASIATQPRAVTGSSAFAGCPRELLPAPGLRNEGTYLASCTAPRRRTRPMGLTPICPCAAEAVASHPPRTRQWFAPSSPPTCSGLLSPFSSSSPAALHTSTQGHTPSSRGRAQPRAPAASRGSGCVPHKLAPSTAQPCTAHRSCSAGDRQDPIPPGDRTPRLPLCPAAPGARPRWGPPWRGAFFPRRFSGSLAFRMLLLPHSGVESLLPLHQLHL